jgi:peptide/nickel transport system substrate-binding protein/oligopeptide transport system substrate-binding protein
MAQTWSSGQPVVLKAFTEFSPTPRLDGIEFLPYSDASASWLPYLNGAIDVAEVPAGQISAAAKVYGDKGYQPFLAGYYLGLNVASPALKDLHFRKAIDRAVNRKRIASKIYKGTPQPPRGIVPQGMPGFQENVCFKLCDYSASAARRLVHKVPKKKRKVRLEYTLGPPHGAVAKAVKKDLEAVGIHVTVKGYRFKPYLRKLRTGKQEMYRLGWIAEYPDPDVFLSSLFASTSPDNHSGLSSSKVDKMLAKARAEPIEGVRVQDYIAAEKAILKHAPIVPIGSFVTHWAAQRYVDGIQFDQMGGFDADRVSIAAH